MSTPISDYTNRDYDSLVATLLDVAALKVPEWTDQSENDLGRLLLELFAYVGDVIAYYLDRIANEAFLATAVERRSVIDLLSLIGYRLDTPWPAAVDLALTPKDAVNPVQVDPGALFTTVAAAGSPPVQLSFLPQDGLPIAVVPVVDPVTGLPEAIDVPVLNATPVASALGQSNGYENQGFLLPQTPVILARDPAVWDGFVVEVQSAAIWEEWQRQTTLLYSMGNDPHYVVEVDEYDAAQVIFGDGQYGRIPPLNAPIRARYLVGGGSSGNVAPGTITVVASGVSVPATVTNPVGASGGADRESIDHARQNAPGVYRSQQRAVTADDYVRLAESFPGVARAVAVAPGWDHTIPPAQTTAAQAAPGLVSWNYVDLLVVASGGLDLNDPLRAGLMEYFETRRPVTTVVAVREPVFVLVDLSVDVGVAPTFYRADVEQRATEALEALFDIDVSDFGKPFYLSKVYEAVDGVDGVAFTNVTIFSGRRSYPVGEIVDPAALAVGRITLRPREFPRQGVVTVTTSGGVG